MNRMPERTNAECCTIEGCRAAAVGLTAGSAGKAHQLGTILRVDNTHAHRPSGRGRLRPSHRLALRICQRAPDPLHRTELVTAQPPYAERDLKTKNHKGQQQPICGRTAPIQPESITIEDHGANHGLQQVISQGHATA